MLTAINPDVLVLLAKLASLVAAGFSALLQALPTILAVAGVLWPIVRPVVRAAVARSFGTKAAAAMDIVESSVKPAVSAVMQSVKNSMQRATRPDSPGGIEVRPDEYAELVVNAVSEAMNVLRAQGTLQLVIDSYGGERVLLASLTELVEREVGKHHGITRPAGTFLPPAISVTPPSSGAPVPIPR